MNEIEPCQECQEPLKTLDGIIGLKGRAWCENPDCNLGGIVFNIKGHNDRVRKLRELVEAARVLVMQGRGKHLPLVDRLREALAPFEHLVKEDG